MPLEALSSHIGGDVVVLAPKVLGDDRGFFMETYRADNSKLVCLPNRFKTTTHRSRRVSSELTLPTGPADGQTDARNAWYRIPELLSTYARDRRR